MQLQTNDIIFHNWKIKNVIGSGSFGTVYEIEREEFGRMYKAAAKVITIPGDSYDMFQSAKEGMTEENTIEYYKSLVEDIISECDLLERMKGNSHIVSYEDHYVEEREDGRQWTIYIRMELLKPLLSLITDENHFFEREQVIHIGMDICRGLETCQKFNVVHRDIKLENIFVSDIGNYKLGDFGISKILEGSELAVSQKGTKLYMAPEMFRGKKYDATVDIYSLGLVLYRLLNHNRAPFMPAYPQSIHLQDKETALQRRLVGEKLPAPCNADERISKVVQKACEYEPGKRYQTPYEMRAALEHLLKASDGLSAQANETEEDDSTKTLWVQNTMGRYTFEQTGSTTENKKRRRKIVAGIAGMLIMMILAAGIVCNRYNQMKQNISADILATECVVDRDNWKAQIAKLVAGGTSAVEQVLEAYWITVPDVMENTEEKAIHVLIAAGYQMEQIIIVHEYSSDVVSGVVMEQSVEALTLVKKDTEITITISKGRKPSVTTQQPKADNSNPTWIEVE